MVGVPNEWRDRAEARWLSDVEVYLRSAQALLEPILSDDAADRELSARIDGALAEALSLRVTRMIAANEKIHPLWSESGLWPMPLDARGPREDPRRPQTAPGTAPAEAASSPMSPRTPG